MAKINVDITTKVDISCREGDDFELSVDVTNTDGSQFIFENKTILFAIYDDNNTPIKICTNDSFFPANIQVISGTHIVGDRQKQTARAFTSLYGLESSVFNHELAESNYYIIPWRTKLEGVTHSLYLQNIQVLNTGLKITIDSFKFNIPAGSYKYDLKFVSDLQDVLNATNDNTTQSFYKNSSTFMEGKFVINKN